MASDIKLYVSFRKAGLAVQNYELFSRAWDECIELQQQTKDEWIGRSLLSIQGLARYEIGAIVNGDTVGGIVLALDEWDAHVGVNCLSVFAQYVLPEYRNLGISNMFMRKALQIAKEDGMQTLAYTHRIADWRYETIYRRLHNEERPES